MTCTPATREKLRQAAPRREGLLLSFLGAPTPVVTPVVTELRTVLPLLLPLLACDRPQVNQVLLILDHQRFCLVRLPVPHDEAVRHDPRAWLQFGPQDRPEEHVQLVAHV